MSKIRIVVMLTLTVAFLSLLAAVPAVAGKPLQQASGGGFFHVDDQSGQENHHMFAFNAEETADGTIMGQMQHNNITKGFNVHLGIVEMVEVDAGVVWLRGMVTNSNNPSVPPTAYKCVLFVDNGEGMHADPDESSKLTNCPGSSTTYPLEGGNIQVR